MVIDFFQQILYTAIFFLGIAGVGMAILKLIKYEPENVFLKVSVAFFISLCLFIITAVLLLFVVSDKLLFLKIFSILYFLASFLVFFYAYRGKAKNIGNFLKSNWLVFSVFLVVIFLFFLQLYHTSILDEWLHRPVVKFFTTNGIFPLQNPLSPGSNFIYTYHYGSEIFSSVIQLISRIGVSESLDIFKLSFFVGGFFLFYGIILRWSNGKKWYAALGAVIVLFCGASFFFVDGFTTGYLHKVKGLEQLWVMNAPFSFGICSITGIGNFLAITFVILIEDLFYRKNNFDMVTFIIFSFLFSGFFLLGELFATISLVGATLVILYKLIKRKVSIKNVLSPILIFIVLFLSGVYFSGGVVGNIFVNKWKSVIAEKSNVEISPIKIEESVVIPTAPVKVTPKLFSFRNFSDWGYSSENEIMKIWEHPFFYLRNFFLEMILFVVFAWAFTMKKIKFSDHPCLFSLVIVCFAAPFFLSTSWGDLNFYKLTVFGLVLLHLLTFYLFARIESKKLFIAVLILFVFGTIPGLLNGINIQWRFFSGKGGEVYCSQNPLCYDEDSSKFLIEFEKENLGLKYILNNGGRNVGKIVDLTNSYSVVANDDDLNYDYLRRKSVQFIFNPDDFKKTGISNLVEDGLASRVKYDGKSEMLKVNY